MRNRRKGNHGTKPGKKRYQGGKISRSIPRYLKGTSGVKQKLSRVSSFGGERTQQNTWELNRKKKRNPQEKFR